MVDHVKIHMSEASQHCSRPSHPSNILELHIRSTPTPTRKFTLRSFTSGHHQRLTPPLGHASLLSHSGVAHAGDASNSGHTGVFERFGEMMGPAMGGGSFSAGSAGGLDLFLAPKRERSFVPLGASRSGGVRGITNGFDSGAAAGGLAGSLPPHVGGSRLALPELEARLATAPSDASAALDGRVRRTLANAQNWVMAMA
jgi:hypothetical protein